MKPRPAYTLLELLVVVAILALLLSIIMPSLSQTHERAKRTVCATNLHGIAAAMYIYAQSAPYTFPAAADVYQPNQGTQSSNMRLFYPQDRTTAPSSTGIPSPTVDLWTLVRRSYTAPRQFNCPSTIDTPDPAQDSMAYYDFLATAHLSYGYQYQHDPNRPILGITSGPTFPLVADGNPYVKGGIPGSTFAVDRISQFRGNSVNHPSREGQNVLFVGGHVDWEYGPDVGISGRFVTGLTISRGRDHCYTTHSNAANASVDYGSAAPAWSGPSSTGSCDLGSKSDACLVP